MEIETYFVFAVFAFFFCNTFANDPSWKDTFSFLGAAFILGIVVFRLWSVSDLSRIQVILCSIAGFTAVCAWYRLMWRKMDREIEMRKNTQ